MYVFETSNEYAIVFIDQWAKWNRHIVQFFFILFVQRENGKYVHCFAIYKIYGSKWAFVHFFFILLLLLSTTTHLLLISFLYFISLFTKRFSMKNERQGDNIITKFIWNVYFMWLIIIHVADIFQMKVETFESQSIRCFFLLCFRCGFSFSFSMKLLERCKLWIM